jgi:hypothetical protein
MPPRVSGGFAATTPISNKIDKPKHRLNHPDVARKWFPGLSCRSDFRELDGLGATGSM